MKQHFVTYLSPGSFFSEETTLPVDSWNAESAAEQARTIKERHGATPYAFHFSTRSRGPMDLDSKVTATSGTYYLGGKVETLEDVEARSNPDERILLSNMKGNGWDRIITNTNSYKITQPIREGDVVLDWKP